MGSLPIVRLAALALALAGCATTPTGDQPGPGVASGGAANVAAAADKEKEPEQPMTRTKAASDCWMRTEKEGMQRNIDARLAAVEKCIAEKMKGTAQAEPKPKQKPKT